MRSRRSVGALAGAAALIASAALRAAFAAPAPAPAPAPTPAAPPKLEHNGPDTSLPCERPCLMALVNRYQKANLKHRPKAAPLAPGFEAWRDGKLVGGDDAFWRSITFVGYEFVLTDQTTQTSMMFGALERGAVASYWVLRLQAQAQDIKLADVTVIDKDSSKVFSSQSPATLADWMGVTPAGGRMATRSELSAAALRFARAWDERKADGVRWQGDPGTRLRAGLPTPLQHCHYFINNRELTQGLDGDTTAPRRTCSQIIAAADFMHAASHWPQSRWQIPVVDEGRGLVVLYASRTPARVGPMSVVLMLKILDGRVARVVQFGSDPPNA